MGGLDILVIIIYVLLLLGIGAFFSRRMKNSSEMFAASRQSPWWISGISSYMTMFSAGTFVVWGGIAYEHGFVSISISLCYGIAAFFAGKFFAGRWQKMGLETPAEFIQLRFGSGAFHFFTWFKIFSSLISGLSLYGVAVMLAPLIPLPDGNFLQSTVTGNLSVDWACLILGVIIIFYTMAGGLWAVLVAGTMQFFVLTLAVGMLVPLCLANIGGFNEFLSAAPEGFLRPTTGEYTWYFLMGWVLTTLFMLGGEWPFIQRYLCVPTPRDARKSCYLFCGLYLTTPFLWMFPAMAYRIMNPNADPQEAYILVSKELLPAGMIGLMVAAMFSATSSSISAWLNVFAGVLTDDVYCKLLRPKASQKELVFAGRISTILLGCWMLLGALLLPRLSSYRNIIIVYGSIIGPSLFLPTIWGLWSRRISKSAVWSTLLASVIVGFLLKLGFSPEGWFSDIPFVSGALPFIEKHSREMDLIVGFMVPLFVLTICELIAREQAPGWENLERVVEANQKSKSPGIVSDQPAKIMALNLFALAFLMVFMALISDKKLVLAVSSVILFVFGCVFASLIRLADKKKKQAGLSENHSVIGE